MRHPRRLLLIGATIAASLATLLTPATPALAEPPAPAPTPPPQHLELSSVQPELRDRVLGANWQKSNDLAVTTAAKRVTRAVVATGQLTSAVPVGDTVVAADGARLVEVRAGGELTQLAATDSVPFDLRATADGGVAFATRDGASVKVRQYLRGETRELASGPLGELTVQAGTNGRVFLVGRADRQGALPQGVSLSHAANSLHRRGHRTNPPGDRAARRPPRRADPRERRGRRRGPRRPASARCSPGASRRCYVASNR